MTFEQWFHGTHYNHPFIGELEHLFRDCWCQAQREGIQLCIDKLGGNNERDKDMPCVRGDLQ